MLFNNQYSRSIKITENTFKVIKHLRNNNYELFIEKKYDKSTNYAIN